ADAALAQERPDQIAGDVTGHARRFINHEVAMLKIFIAVGEGAIGHGRSLPISCRWQKPQYNLDSVALATARRPLDRDGYGPIKHAGGECEVQNLRVPVLANKPGTSKVGNKPCENIRLTDQIAGHCRSLSSFRSCFSIGD